MTFPSSTVVKNLPANAEDMGSIPGLGNISVFYYLWSVKFLPDFGILGCMHPWVYVTKL